MAEKINAAAEKSTPASANEMADDDMMNTRDKASKEKAVLGKKNKPITTQYTAGNNSMVSQVAGIIIGSPEFQRK
jgi:hypothetical protein